MSRRFFQTTTEVSALKDKGKYGIKVTQRRRRNQITRVSLALIIILTISTRTGRVTVLCPSRRLLVCLFRHIRRDTNGRRNQITRVSLALIIILTISTRTGRVTVLCPSRRLLVCLFRHRRRDTNGHIVIPRQ